MKCKQFLDQNFKKNDLLRQRTRIVDKNNNYENLSIKFQQIISSTFQQQYSHLYFSRLNLLRPLYEQYVKQIYEEDIIVYKVLNTKRNTKCCIIGTFGKSIYKCSSNNGNNKFNKETELQREENLVDEEQDVAFIEDETGRMKVEMINCTYSYPSFNINNEKITIHDLPMGIIISIIGKFYKNSFKAHQLLFLPLCQQEQVYPPLFSKIDFLSKQNSLYNNQQTLEQLLSMNEEQLSQLQFIGFISGLQIDTSITTSQLLLLNFILGIQNSNIFQIISQNVKRIIFCGNMVKGQQEHSNISQKYNIDVEEEKNLQSQLQYEAKNIQELDNYLAKISLQVNFDIMPGLNDPVEDLWPQQGLNPAALPQTLNKSSFANAVTNPYMFKQSNISFLGTNGDNIKDILRFTKDYQQNYDRELKALELILQTRNLAPGVPGTLPSMPLVEDLFVLEQLPHVMFVGNTQHFFSKLIYIEKENKVIRLIGVPNFQKQSSLILLNLNNLDVFEINFN